MMRFNGLTENKTVSDVEKNTKLRGKGKALMEMLKKRKKVKKSPRTKPAVAPIRKGMK